MAQFTCEVCGDGFDQKSRFERHMATSHPERAPSAADVEKALSGIQYPKTREELVQFASQRVPDKYLMNLIQSLPARFYRDSAEVAIALGEVKSRQVRSEAEAARTEQPSKAGGRSAATASVSAATIAKVLSGTDFPKRKEELKNHAQRHMTEVEVADPQAILDVIDRLPDKEYGNMADVEKSVGQVL
jgi:hypothetical protein